MPGASEEGPQRKGMGMGFPSNLGAWSCLKLKPGKRVPPWRKQPSCAFWGLAPATSFTCLGLCLAGNRGTSLHMEQPVCFPADPEACLP